ncbi:DNA-binding transcriptional regulator, MerR family [Cohaesibacter sp. ES.047]|uniref:MerR family transcriptional regulator n=1 Tax=Cohaesibacter sp. ES.047 TaxID=1798205 RepID=UPI000BB7B0B8|nr:MerR family transcriptional regulator [Cohaesibacter sp. ES.047]SNY91863.1 DNA-binding transcriptional regulator, MerR family [Cohaesibacter sp. ES.047]
MKIGDLAAKTGLSVHTIRYYEKIGLLPDAHRDAGGRRQYGMEITNWLTFLKHLKTTGMGISRMVRYARLRAEGPHTATERRQMLEDQRADVQTQIRRLQETLPVLDKKIAIYLDMENAHIMEASNDRSTKQIPRVQPASERP